MYIDSFQIELLILKSIQSWKMTKRVFAVQLGKFQREKLKSLSLDHIFDDMRAKMLQRVISSGNAGVCVVVALHCQEEAVE